MCWKRRGCSLCACLETRGRRRLHTICHIAMRHARMLTTTVIQPLHQDSLIALRRRNRPSKARAPAQENSAPVVAAFFCYASKELFRTIFAYRSYAVSPNVRRALIIERKTGFHHVEVVALFINAGNMRFWFGETSDSRSRRGGCDEPLLAYTRAHAQTRKSMLIHASSTRARGRWLRRVSIQHRGNCT